MSFINPDRMTAYQRVLLEGWPPKGIPAFERFIGPIDRAEAVEAGAVTDPILLDLLEKLGTSCECVDDAARYVIAAADAVGEKHKKAPTYEAHLAAGEEVKRIFGPLRNIAVRLWRELDNSESRENPMYEPVRGGARP